MQVSDLGILAVLVAATLAGLPMAVAARRLRVPAATALVVSSFLLMVATWAWSPTIAERRSIPLRLQHMRLVGRTSESTSLATSAVKWYLSSSEPDGSIRTEVKGAKVDWLPDSPPIVFGDRMQIAGGNLSTACGVFVTQLFPTALEPPEVHLSDADAATRLSGKLVLIGLIVVCS